MSKSFDYRKVGQRVLETELAALRGLQEYMNEQFNQACELMLHCSGKVIVMGMGKSGHIARKMAATFASTGTAAFFVHPGEASHGDLGMISAQDVVIAISNSGESSEILALLPVLKRWGNPLICMTSNPNSTMANESDIHLCIRVPEEACPLGLAPTSSTTATLVMGDALAVALLEARGFTSDDFAMSHPGGALGRKLLLRTADLNHHGGFLPQVARQASVRDALLEDSDMGLGMTTILNEDGTLAGLFTDGDLRRILDQRIDIHQTAIECVMKTQCITVGPEMLAAEAVQLMQSKKINGLVVVDKERRPVGAFNMHDVLKAGVV